LAAPLVECAGMARAITTDEAPGAARVRFRFRSQDVLLILLGVVATAALAAAIAFGAWLGSSMVQVREDIVHLRGAVARNAESIRHIERRLDTMDSRLDTMDSRLDSMDSRLDSMDARLAAMQSSLALLVERSGGEAAPRR